MYIFGLAVVAGGLAWFLVPGDWFLRACLSGIAFAIVLMLGLMFPRWGRSPGRQSDGSASGNPRGRRL